MRFQARLATFLLFAAILLPTSGCRLHQPLAPQPPAPMPAAFRHATAGAPPAPGLVAPWWRAFKDPHLDRLETTLIADNLDIKQAYARLRELEAASRAAEAPLFPFLNLGAETGRSRQATTGNTAASTGQLSLAAGYEIDLWRKLANQRSIARLTADASREQLKTLYLTLTCQAADLFYLAHEQQAQLALTDAIINTLTTTRDQVELRYRQGLTTSLYLHQADLALAAARSQRPGQQTALTISEHGLAILLGRYPEAPAAAQATAELPPPPALFSTGLPARLLTQRPDINAAALRVRAADAGVAAAIANRFPAVNLLAGLGASRTDSGPTVLHSTFWSLLIDLTQPIIDGGRRRAEVDRQQALLAETLAAYQQTVLKAFQEVEDALVANQGAEEQLGLLRKQAATALATRQRAEDGYRLGINDSLAMLDSQRQDQEVRRQLLAARRRLLSARIGLARALGGGWLDKTLAENLPPTAAEDGDHAQ